VKLLLDYGARPSLIMDRWNRASTEWQLRHRKILYLMRAAEVKNTGSVHLQPLIASEAASLF
jgi:hypothetical protein